MPTYEYGCDCGLQFDGRAPVADRKKPKTCPACGEKADPIPPSTVSGHFKKDVTGAGPQNTGIHDLDTNIDRVIGQSSAQGWEVAAERRRDKEAVMAATGAAGDSLSKNPDGSYRVLSPAEKAAHKRSQAIHERAGEWARRKVGR